MKVEKILGNPIKTALGKLADRIERYAVEAVEDYHAIATGKLRNAIHVRLDGDEKEGYRLICYAEGSTAPYAQYVHEGRKPGKMPPISPLMEWARKKMGDGGVRLFPQIGSGMVSRTRIHYTKRGISPNKQDMQAFNAARQIAWAVAKGIEQHGIPAKPFFVEAVEKALRGM